MLFMERNELCWCGSGKKYKKCHMPIEEKILLHSERGEIVPTRAILKTAEQIEKIKESARLNTCRDRRHRIYVHERTRGNPRAA